MGGDGAEPGAGCSSAIRMAARSSCSSRSAKGFCPGSWSRGGRACITSPSRPTTSGPRSRASRSSGFELVDVNLDDPNWKEAFLRPSKAHGTLVQVAQSAAPDDDRQARPAPVEPGGIALRKLIAGVTSRSKLRSRGRGRFPQKDRRQAASARRVASVGVRCRDRARDRPGGRGSIRPRHPGRRRSTPRR